MHIDFLFSFGCCYVIVWATSLLRYRHLMKVLLLALRLCSSQVEQCWSQAFLRGAQWQEGQTSYRETLSTWKEKNVSPKGCVTTEQAPTGAMEASISRDHPHFIAQGHEQKCQCGKNPYS